MWLCLSSPGVFGKSTNGAEPWLEIGVGKRLFFLRGLENDFSKRQFLEIVFFTLGYRLFSNNICFMLCAQGLGGSVKWPRDWFWKDTVFAQKLQIWFGQWLFF